jgi:hypothetical protein
MSAREVSTGELFDELKKATLRAVEAEEKLAKVAALADKWANVYVVAGIFPDAVPWAEGVDHAYHTAADELRVALGVKS